MSTRSNSGFETLISMMSHQGMNMTNAAALGSSSNPLHLLSGHDTDTSKWSSEELDILMAGLERHKDEPYHKKVLFIGDTLPHKHTEEIVDQIKRMGESFLQDKSSLPSVLPHHMAFNPFSLPSTIAGDLSGPAMNLFEQNVQAYRQMTASLSSHKRKIRDDDLISGGRTSSFSKDKSSVASVSPHHMSFYPFIVPSKIAGDLSGPAMNLLEQNVQAFHQMRANFSSNRVEDNLDLLRQTWNNLITIQNDVSYKVPGVSDNMIPLPVTMKDISVLPFNTKQGGGFPY